MKCHFYRAETQPLNKQEVPFRRVKCYLSAGGELPQQTRSNLSTTNKIPFERREAHF